MKGQVLAVMAMMAVAHLSALSMAKPPKGEQNKFKKLMKRFDYESWESCNNSTCLKNACECDECVVCDAETDSILSVDWSGVGLQLHKGKVPQKDISKFLKKAKHLESFDITNNTALLEDSRDCIKLKECSKNEELCEADFTICNMPTGAPTIAPRNYANEWEYFYDVSNGAGWNKEAGKFTPFPCTGKGTGKVKAVDNKYIYCTDGYLTEIYFHNQYVDGEVSPEIIEAILTSPGFTSFYIHDDDYALTTTSCIDSMHEIFEPYGPVAVEDFVADNITICPLDDPVEDETEAWTIMFDALGGKDWKKCSGKRTNPSDCNYLTQVGGYFTEINFTEKMGFDDVSDLKYEILKFAMTLQFLEVFDISGEKVCFSEEYQDLLGCDDTVECTFHASCDDEEEE
ncbi:Hypothetical Protein FCC1311_072312 [Hondaea fermentalgiana]|uniref:Uncharacterized protein n=1 Tax=Hondaea fermentalgiana TaxID=2315210 RepID=A0A2R5GJE9_9STRA|nr:Hypothetical Protein FCC1311_072312 [Hondaea fermentalgiana]|eukprot:GBG31010.1 Hypothetical Protein FCC1311_072312 [Hondaea fermentalgiana]